MKTVVLIFIGSWIGLSACKKNYTCYCTTTTTHPAYTYNSVSYAEKKESTIAHFSNKGKKRSLQSECDARSYNTQQASTKPGQPDLTVDNVCILKADNGM